MARETFAVQITEGSGTKRARGTSTAGDQKERNN
jgi:hypothetical protein